MKSIISVISVAVVSASPLLAQGDAAAGEGAFRQCQACHVVVDDAGETLAGRNGRTGPNLYQISGREAGTVEGVRYSDALVNAGQAGLTWDQDTFVEYVQDPTEFLREYLGDGRARGNMSYKVRKEADAHDLYAYIASLGGDGGS